jgi:hypothetical protein
MLQWEKEKFKFDNSLLSCATSKIVYESEIYGNPVMEANNSVKLHLAAYLW